MDSSLVQLWEGAASSPFLPTIGKGTQFLVGFTLLVVGVLLSGLFGLNRSLVTLPIIGLPASLAVGFGAVYMICAAGVYV